MPDMPTLLERPVRQDVVGGGEAAPNPFDRRAAEAGGNAVTLAVMALRALFLLNGGALIVFPAYLSLLGADVDAAYVAAATAAVIFIAGLVLAVLATLFAYLSEIARTRAEMSRASAAAPGALSGDAGNGFGVTKSARRIGRLRIAAAAAVLLSLVCFACGSYFAAVAVMAGPADDEAVGTSRIGTAL